MVRTRESTAIATVNKKRSLCGPLALIPFVGMVIGEFGVPIVYLGMIEFTKALGSMS